MVAVALCCIVVGVLHPLSTEYSKTAVVSVGTLGVTRNVMPFHPVTLTIAAEVISVVVAAVIMTLTEGSLKATFSKVIDIQAWLPLLPVGIIYGLGDFLQTAACNVASSHVVLVVGQSKVLLTALISSMLLKRNTKTKWFWLILIFMAATVSAELTAETSPARSLELQGAALSFTKAALSSTGAAVSEALYKKGTGDFWEVSFRIQFLMMLTSIVLLPWTYGSFQILDPTEFFFGGPNPVCPLEVGSMCATRRGWDTYTVLAALAIALNGAVTGLTLKHLSAVSKAVCNAVGSGAFYLCYVIAGFKSFSLAQAFLSLVIMISSYKYSMSKAGGNSTVKTASRIVFCTLTAAEGKNANIMEP